MLKQIAFAGLLSVASARSVNLSWSEGVIRMNHMQVIGTHNSYHVETTPEDLELQKMMPFHWKTSHKVPDFDSFRYSYPPLDHQLEHMAVRSLELDVVLDPKGGKFRDPPAWARDNGRTWGDNDSVWDEPGTKVMNEPHMDTGTTCKSMRQCLETIKDWVVAHPAAVPVTILMHFKCNHDRLKSYRHFYLPLYWSHDDHLDRFDEEVREVFPPELLITPDDVRDGRLSIEKSILGRGWPDLDSARGRVVFLMHNPWTWNGARRYRGQYPLLLKGRVMFTNSIPGMHDCAFQRIDEPPTEELLKRIQEQVNRGYLVRTRADEPLVEVRDQQCNKARRNLVFKTGAQIISTNFPARGMSYRWLCEYTVRLPKGRTAVCSPGNTTVCEAGSDLEHWASKTPSDQE